MPGSGTSRASARGSACGALVSYLLQLSTSARSSTTCSSSGSSTRAAPRRPTSTSTSARSGGTRSSTTSGRSTATPTSRRSCTFGTLKAKAAIKDVGRALNIPLARVEQINKLVPGRLNITLEDAIKEEPALKRLADDDPEVERLLDFARRLEGMNRNAGTHAAGVVIADRPLEELVPLQKLPNKDKAREVVTTQWEMGDIEKAGLLKMDFLGLRNFTTLAAAVRIINARHPDVPDRPRTPPAGRPQDLRDLPAAARPRASSSSSRPASATS